MNRLQSLALLVAARLDFWTYRLGDYWHALQLAQLQRRGALQIGAHTYGLRSNTVSGATPAQPVVIGSFCSFAPGVCILSGVEHALTYPSTFPFLSRGWRLPANHSADVLDEVTGCNADARSRGSVRVGHDVWIGQNAIVLSGVEIGTGAAVGAGAVVTRSLPPYAIAVGNPARVLRQRFPEELVERLLASRWWDLPDGQVRGLLPHLYSERIEAFLAAVDAARADMPAGLTSVR